MSVTLPKKEVVNLPRQGNAPVRGSTSMARTRNVLVKDVQYDHLGLEVLHVDFARVNLDEKVKVTIPLELQRHAEGRSRRRRPHCAGHINELEIERLVTKIPDIIRHNVNEMAMDSVLHIRNVELTLPKGVRVLQDGELIVATVREILEQAAAPVAAEGTAEPEVIAKGKIEEEGAAAAAEGGAEKKK